MNPEIEKIYQFYPKKVAKPKALAKIAQAVKKHGLLHVSSQTQEYARLVAIEVAQGADKGPIPHPSTWYGQERYNDDSDTWIEYLQKSKEAKGETQEKSAAKLRKEYQRIWGQYSLQHTECREKYPKAWAEFQRLKKLYHEIAG